MPHAFTSKKIEDNFGRVVSGLESIGYTGLLERGYDFPDYFSKGTPTRLAPAVAFGQTPHSYDNACFVVIVSNGEPGHKLIAAYRAVGAPRAFEVKDDAVVDWKVGATPESSNPKRAIRPEELQSVFESHADQWNPKEVLRLKSLVDPAPRQRDFMDLGLIPALEQHIKHKLDPLLHDVLYGAKAKYEKKHQQPVDTEQLVRLVFRALAGKVMNDRGLLPFSKTTSPTADELLEVVAKHYGDYKPIADDKAVRQYTVDRLWENVSFKNLSVETLAYIWETTLVTKETRKTQSIHATPPSIARYMVHRLPIDRFPEDERRIVEPCCGSGTFLIAGLQRLRELTPPGMDGRKRHDYFKNMLSGFDNDTFGLEVARSCLMLADFPNADGWALEQENVFDAPKKSPKFYAALRAASIVLCNPPFGTFSAFDRERFSTGAYKPVEILTRVLENIPDKGLLGFVMPQQLLSGDSYPAIRKQLAERYDELEVVSLPDKVFERSEQETALLLATHPRVKPKTVAINHRKVADADAWEAFNHRHTILREDKGRKTIAEAEKSLAVPDLTRVWSFLAGATKLRQAAAEIHRGIEWNKTIEEYRELLISATAKPGFKRGLPSAPRGKSFIYQRPPVAYLNVENENRKSDLPFTLPWESPKIITNAKRRSRGPWRLSAFVDTEGIICYQTYTCIWPTNDWKPTVLSAILNGYIANAFVTAIEGNHRDITLNTTLSEIPLPKLSEADIIKIDTLVGKYVAVTGREGEEAFWTPATETRLAGAAGILNEIDALVLRAYKLPSQLLQEVLAYFRQPKGYRQVPFEFVAASRQLGKAMNVPGLKLVQKWLADESGYDEKVWPEVKKGIEEDSLSQRKRFHD
jgi:N-6 DNA Methylase